MSVRMNEKPKPNQSENSNNKKSVGNGKHEKLLVRLAQNHHKSYEFESVSLCFTAR